MKQFVYRELFFAANTFFFFLQNKTKQKKGLYFADKKNFFFDSFHYLSTRHLGKNT